MKDIKEQLEDLIKKTLEESGIEVDKIHLEHPVDLTMGDYSTNVAMVYAKKSGQNPREFAEKIIEKLNLGLENLNVEKVEIAGPGFINFYLNKEFFKKSVKDILDKKEKFGSNEDLNGKKIMIEYTDPNPFKLFHIGHLMSNAIGESIARVIRFNGAEVKRSIYQGDVGLHVAKTIYGVLYCKDIIKEGGEDVGTLKERIDFYIKNDDIFEKTTGKERQLGLSTRVSLLGFAYKWGDEQYRGGEEAKKKIIEINKEIYNKPSGEIKNYYEFGKKWSLYNFEVIYDLLGMRVIKDNKYFELKEHFDFYYLESNTGILGKKLVEDYLKKGVFEKSDGAIIFSEKKSGLHTRVFINSEGLPTYEAKELGLAKIKYEDYPYDKSIVITGNEVDGYFKVLLKAMEFVYPELASKTKHISHGMLRLPEGKMSSRFGNVEGAFDFLVRIKNFVLGEKMENFVGDQTIKEEVSEKIALGAVKYSILKSSTGKNIIFDKEKALSLEGNSGPYLQYTYARAMSVLEKAESEKISKWSLETEGQEKEILEIEKMLYRFPEVVKRAGEEYEPHYIATYLFELAQIFNSYYGNNKIVDSSEASSPYRVALTKAVAYVIKNGLNLLGIESPKRL